MQIPYSFPEHERESIRKCFFGINKKVSLAIFTPLNSFFKLFSSQNENHNGWWKSIYFDGILVTHVPQSSAILDAISSLEPSTKIIFVGIAGSLGKLKIGDIVEVSSSLLEKKLIERSYDSQYFFPKTKNTTVSSIAAIWSKNIKMPQDIECVDMETGYLYAASKLQNKFSTSILIISDDITTIPFYKCNIDNLSESFKFVRQKIISS